LLINPSLQISELGFIYGILTHSICAEPCRYFCALNCHCKPFQLPRSRNNMSRGGYPGPFISYQFMIGLRPRDRQQRRTVPVRKINRGNTMKLSLSTALIASVLMTGTAYAAEPEVCKSVRFADVGWTDVQVTTGVATNVLEALGYETEVKTLSVPVTFASLKNKDIDVFLGNWMPSMSADIKAYTEDKSVETIATNLEGAGYGLVVPQYVADGGVKSLTDLGLNKDKFEGKIYGIEAGNDGNRIISEMIAKPDNKLEGYELVESSEAGMLTEAEKAIKDQKWIAFLGWTPHPIMGDMKLHYLDGMGDSGFGAATVHTNVRAGYVGECPNVGKLLTNLKFDLAMEGAMMAPVLKDGADPKAVAKDWLKANPDSVKPWIEGVTAFDGSDAAAAIAAAMQ
jgi:glycine betaine/proline transport system substrate-binding protein